MLIKFEQCPFPRDQNDGHLGPRCAKALAQHETVDPRQADVADKTVDQMKIGTAK